MSFDVIFTYIDVNLSCHCFQNELQKRAQAISMLSFYITEMHVLSFGSLFNLFTIFVLGQWQLIVLMLANRLRRVSDLTCRMDPRELKNPNPAEHTLCFPLVDF